MAGLSDRRLYPGASAKAETALSLYDLQTTATSPCPRARAQRASERRRLTKRGFGTPARCYRMTHTPTVRRVSTPSKATMDTRTPLAQSVAGFNRFSNSAAKASGTLVPLAFALTKVEGKRLSFPFNGIRNLSSGSVGSTSFSNRTRTRHIILSSVGAFFWAGPSIMVPTPKIPRGFAPCLKRNTRSPDPPCFRAAKRHHSVASTGLRLNRSKRSLKCWMRHPSGAFAE